MSHESEESTRPPTNTSGERLERRNLLSRGERLDQWLWAVALLGLVLDVGFSYHGIRLGLPEINPFVHHASQSLGLFGGLLFLKGFAVAVALSGRVVLPRRYRWIVPLSLAVPWMGATVVNAVVLLSLV